MMDALSLSPALAAMIEDAGVLDVYDFPPSALDCGNPIVVCDERYERTDLLDDCEYGRASLDVLVVRETKAECIGISGTVVYALHRADWERYSTDRLRVRNVSVLGLPEQMADDASGRKRFKICVCMDVCVSHE